MAQLLIEENFQHLDGQDVEDLIEAFEELGLRAEPTQPRSEPTRRGWVLTLHWLRDETETVTDPVLGAALASAVRDVLSKEHEVGCGGTRVRGRTLPARIDIRDRTGTLVTTLAVPPAH
ncbi:hypothetical protein [Streptacidiphilus fuscans]|uniref:Uncharacterized protein n=1 Tax=Streptacidiphilus fuscans TaxID=2789292 RepID=A0A931B9S5_9ACTN|nr:hypothetical protein [Streptacidiphilus fuscans]MBF9069495.1 hypothetical protein [Streptacidiphilus fuscans]